jgi:hypothetical protein
MGVEVMRMAKDKVQKQAAVLEDFMDRILEMADRLINFLYVETPWEIALGAVAVAAITGDVESGERLLDGYYHAEEADAVYDLLELATSLGR